MKLQNAPFEAIKSGSKTVEMRLYDEKRRLIRPGDTVVFTNMRSGENMSVRVSAVKAFMDFAELYDNYDKTALGYAADECADSSDMLEYYSDEQVKKYGVVAITVAVK